MVDIVSQFIAVAAYLLALPLVVITFTLVTFIVVGCSAKIACDFITYIVDFFRKK